MKRLLALGVVAMIALAVTSAGANTLRVPQDYPTIQAAIDAAHAGDIVQVAAGTYRDVTHQLPGDTTRCAVIMKSGVTLQGAGQGSTIINADSLGRGIWCRHVTNASIRSLTVKRAFASIFGAGLLVTDTSSVSVVNVEVTNNFDGGIIFNNYSAGTISGCNITNNLAKQGGGIALETYCSPTIQDCTLAGNAAPVGGGLYVRNFSAPLVNNCIIRNNRLNTQNGSGGGVDITNSQPRITNTSIINNTATGNGGGVAIYDGSSPSFSKCVIQGNTTTDPYYGPGGGVYIDTSSLDMQHCLITHNSVAGSGSYGTGIFVFYCLPVEGHNVVIRQCTIAANSSNSADLSALSIFFAFPAIDKSIIAFNTPGRAMDCQDPGDEPTVSCTDIYGNTGGNQICGTNGGHNFSLDPLFCDLTHDNYRIAMNSPCYPGRHPDGQYACNNDLIGGQDPGCNPNGVDDDASLPTATRLIGNQPNPFHPATTINYEIARAGRVDLRIFDVAGREVRTLAEGIHPAGRHQAFWDGRTASGAAAPSGVYFYRLSLNGVIETRRMVLAR